MPNRSRFPVKLTLRTPAGDECECWDGSAPNANEGQRKHSTCTPAASYGAEQAVAAARSRGFRTERRRRRRDGKGVGGGGAEGGERRGLAGLSRPAAMPG